MAHNTIRIETNGKMQTRNWRVFIGDHDISGLVAGLTLKARAGEHARVHLDLIGIVELPDELQAIVTATLEEVVVGV